MTGSLTSARVQVLGLDVLLAVRTISSGDTDAVRGKVRDLLSGLSVDDLSRVLTYVAVRAVSRHEPDDAVWAAALFEDRQRAQQVDDLEGLWEQSS